MCPNSALLNLRQFWSTYSTRLLCEPLIQTSGPSSCWKHLWKLSPLTKSKKNPGNYSLLGSGFVQYSIQNTIEIEKGVFSFYQRSGQCMKAGAFCKAFEHGMGADDSEN